MYHIYITLLTYTAVCHARPYCTYIVVMYVEFKSTYVRTYVYTYTYVFNITSPIISPQDTPVRTYVHTYILWLVLTDELLMDTYVVVQFAQHKDRQKEYNVGYICT